MYTPVVDDENFQNAIAYLVRRLEENTTPENFLCDLFGLEVGDEAWERQRQRFLDACDMAVSPGLPDSPRRQQNRQVEEHEPDGEGSPFLNEPDTDFSLEQNRNWITRVTGRWCDISPPVVAPVTEADVGRALDDAVQAQPSWEERGRAGRAEILKNVAAVIAAGRGDTIGCLMSDGKKVVVEADAEVSEAVDFASYYALALDGGDWDDGVRAVALGVVLVAPPWNFPYAIPAGGCLAALMAGNAVVLKPPPETVATARRLVEQLWEAGVPRGVLQFLPVPDGEAGKRLVTDGRVAAVILTGAYETARMFQSWKPGIRLSAETSGKNCLVITAAADLDLAIKDLVKSAFGHAGQKCSATSLALVEGEVYDDPKFHRQLKDAAESLCVGPARDAPSLIPPLIREPGPDLKRALTTLDPGESWLLEPRSSGSDPCLYSPGIKLGVTPGSWFHRIECFGPVLGLMRVRDLDDAIRIQNGSTFGLTGGIHSLDEKEIGVWRERVEVGNAYINRSTTGAVVQRQPFGGWKCSSVGSGAKAGGPNYVAGLVCWREDRLPVLLGEPAGRVAEKMEALLSCLASEEERRALRAAAGSYVYWWGKEFSQEHDPSKLYGERNDFRYRPRPAVILRLARSGATAGDALAASQVVLACEICGVPLEISSVEKEVAGQFPGVGVVIEDERELAERIVGLPGVCLRSTGVIGQVLQDAADRSHTTVTAGPVLANGRLELLNYLREQAISQTVHRYGNTPGH